MTEKTINKKILNRYEEFRDREKPIKQTKVIKEDTGIGTHLVKAKIKEKYSYYICDYCGEEIKIEKDISKRTGGTCYLPGCLTNKAPIMVALHNKCFKPVIEEFKEETKNVR